MTDREFQDWFAYHVTAFPEIRAWMKRSTPKDAPDDQKPARAWERVLSRFSVEDCRTATDQLLSGELSAKGFSSHPAAIASYCRGRVSAAMSAGTYQAPLTDCPCEGSGWLTCSVPENPRRTMACICTCHAGDSVVERRQRQKRKTVDRWHEGLEIV